MMECQDGHTVSRLRDCQDGDSVNQDEETNKMERLL